MRSIRFLRCAAVALLLVALGSVAQPEDGGSVETGWLELVKGAKDSTVGAQLVEIEEGDTADTQKITVAIPKTAITSPAQIEEVLVVGQRPEEAEQPERVRFTYEWVSDYDSENYGLVIRLGRNTNWPIRLYMNSDPGFVR